SGLVRGTEAGIIENILKSRVHQVAGLLLLTEELLIQRVDIGKLLVGELTCLRLSATAHDGSSFDETISDSYGDHGCGTVRLRCCDRRAGNACLNRVQGGSDRRSVLSIFGVKDEGCGKVHGIAGIEIPGSAVGCAGHGYSFCMALLLLGRV